jgi:hypothetical protein
MPTGLSGPTEDELALDHDEAAAVEAKIVLAEMAKPSEMDALLGE